MKNKYDSSVAYLYSVGKENLLPKHFRQQIPYSTIYNWRNENYENYLGYEFRYFFDNAFNSVDLTNRYQHLKKAIASIMRSWVALSPILLPILKEAGDNRFQQEKILKAINLLRDNFGLDSALKIIGISKTLYYHWTLEARFDCFDSYTQLCVKRHPQQLQIKEIQKIKSLLTNSATDHWPIVSIAGQALRKKELVASLHSWYKYAKLWGINKKPIKKRRKTVGIVSNIPNEYWHIDTTFYELMDGKKICISFVMDNFSKMILGYHVSGSNNFELVKQSLSKALKTVKKHPHQKPASPSGRHSYLVSDGGKENHNKTINMFIAKLSNHKITKVRALKDIKFSNSPVEAVHRTIKGRYLKNRKFESIKAINTYLKWVVSDYNEVRPHYKHRPRTPQEVYFGTDLGFDIRKRVKTAIKKRVKANKCAGCIQCSGACSGRSLLKQQKPKD